MPGGVTHFAETLSLKAHVTDGEHFIDHQNLGFEKRSHRKRQPHVHAARIAFYRRVQEFVDFGERDDLVKFSFDLATSHAQNCAIQVDVFTAGEFGMKAGAHLEQTADAAKDLG